MLAIAFARLTRYAYCLNLLDARQILANRFMDALRAKGSEKETRREEKINALPGERDAARRDGGKSDGKRDNKECVQRRNSGAQCDEVCRNILQRKPINKGRLGRGIKTHTSRYWLCVSACLHFLVSAGASPIFISLSFFYSIPTPRRYRSTWGLKLIPTGFWLRYNFAIEPRLPAISGRYDRWKARAC